jgi:trans-aconitate methyltransferase
MWSDEDKALHAFRTGCGVPGVSTTALPALEGVVLQLQAGITVADVGCGHGHSTLLMAEAFPNSRFVGFDTHAASIDAARRHAASAGLAERRDAFGQREGA